MPSQPFYQRDNQSIQPNKNLSSLIGELERIRDSVQLAFQGTWDYVSPGGAGNQILALPQEYDHNPVLNPPIDRAYYPSVLYFESGFDVGGTLYKYLCVHSADVDAGGGLLIAGSHDFKTWAQLHGGTPLVGLPATAHHSHVVQTGPSAFRIYYWNSALLYTVAAIRTAVSVDLINWTSDQPVQNGPSPIVTGVFPNWNNGSYGPCCIFHNPTATNTGNNPFDYSYAMYFDGTTGAFESIGLGYSVDGITFNLYGLVLDHGSTTHGNPVPWDSGYTTACTIFRTPLGRWMMLYSGGVSNAYEGIGAAVSDDGLSWTKLTIDHPLLERRTGTWRAQRCYTPSAVTDFENRFSGAGDVADLKMLVSGMDAGGDYTCGYFSIPYIYADVREALYRLGKL